MPVRHFDANANSLSTLAFIFGLKASNDVKTSSLSCLLLPSSQPTFHSKYGQCYLGKNYTTEPSVGARFGVLFFSVSSWKIYLGTEVFFFSRQGFIHSHMLHAVCWGGRLEGHLLISHLLQGGDLWVHGLHPPFFFLFYLVYSRAFLAIKQGLGTLSSSILQRWLIEGQQGFVLWRHVTTPIETRAWMFWSSECTCVPLKPRHVLICNLVLINANEVGIHKSFPVLLLFPAVREALPYRVASVPLISWFVLHGAFAEKISIQLLFQ